MRNFVYRSYVYWFSNYSYGDVTRTPMVYRWDRNYDNTLFSDGFLWLKDFD